MTRRKKHQTKEKKITKMNSKRTQCQMMKLKEKKQK
jgi:hypothetical protein